MQPVTAKVLQRNRGIKSYIECSSVCYDSVVLIVQLIDYACTFRDFLI